MPKGGIIAKGVNRLYRRAGKFLRIADEDLGLAVIECTRPDPDDPDAPTVGQAWEELAKANPRVRAWLLNLIKGGAWQDLVMAHAPIGIALMTKEWVQRLVPFRRAAEVLLEEDEDTEPSDLRPADAEEMRATAEAQAHRIASKLGVKVPPGVAAEAMRQAEEMAARGEVPPGLRRQQPKRQARAGRRG
jgi:acyl-CoA synthetase (NDP forming)